MTNLIAIVVTAALFLVFQLCGACSADAGKAMRALGATSLTEVRLGSYPYFQCGTGDVFNSAFSAVDTHGAPVSGAVCCGWFKGCTVRLE